MAAVQPPATYDEWRTWARRAARYRADWLDGYRPTILGLAQGAHSTRGVWRPLAKDHPFQGAYFCWRCIADAQGFASRVTSHITDDEEIICFKAARNQAAEHPEPDAVTTGPREAVDLGFGPEFERPSYVTDTGTIFYERKA